MENAVSASRSGKQWNLASILQESTLCVTLLVTLGRVVCLLQVFQVGLSAPPRGGGQMEAEPGREGGGERQQRQRDEEELMVRGRGRAERKERQREMGGENERERGRQRQTQAERDGGKQMRGGGRKEGRTVPAQPLSATLTDTTARRRWQQRASIQREDLF